MVVSDSEGRDPKHPWDAVKSPVTPRRKESLPGSHLSRQSCRERKPPGTCRPGRLPWLFFGAQSQVQIQKID